MEKAKTKAKALLLRLGLSGEVPLEIFSRSLWFRLRTTLPAAVICLIAEEPLKFGFAFRCAHVCHRQRHIPMFMYFKLWNHQRVVRWLAYISVAIFIASASGIAWESHFLTSACCRVDDRQLFDFAPGWLVKVLLLVEFVALIFLMITGACMFGLSEHQLEKKCEELGKRITLLFQENQRREKLKLLKARARLKARHKFFKQVLEDTERRLNAMPDDDDEGNSTRT